MADFSIETQLLKNEVPSDHMTVFAEAPKHIAGGDEAGRGALAGPVTAALVILNKDSIDPDINDSKTMTAKKRASLFKVITNSAIAWSYAHVLPEKIDEINILEATKLAFYHAWRNLKIKPDFILFDALLVKQIPAPQKNIIKGDLKSFSIAAASIIAKYQRDLYMKEIADKYPQWHFDIHKGYGTRMHMNAIMENGCCRIHRKSFKPLKKTYDTQIRFI